jgi:hypothetical protein
MGIWKELETREFFMVKGRRFYYLTDLSHAIYSTHLLELKPENINEDCLN